MLRSFVRCRMASEPLNPRRTVQVISAEQHAELLSAVEDRLAGVVLPSRTLQYPDGFPPYPDSSRQWPRPVRGQRELDELCKDWAERPSLAARVDCAVDSYAQRTGALTSASEFSGVAKRVLSGSSAEEAMLAEAAERDHEAGGGKPPDNTRVDGSESHSDAAGATAGASRAPTAAAPAFDAAPSVLPKGGLESAQIGSFQQPGRSSRPKNKKVVDLSSGAAAPASLGGSLPTAPIVAGDMRTPGASAGMPPPVGTGGAAGVAAAGRTLLQQPPPSTTTRVPLPGEVDTAGRPVEPHAQAGRPLHLTVNLGGQLHTINFQQGDASWTVVEPFCADHKLSAEECELVRGEVVKLGGR